MNLNTLKRLCWLLILLSLIPASVLVLRRIQAEESRITVTMLLDEEALAKQAEIRGVSTLELAQHYRTLGANGVALYEDTFESLAAKGDIALRYGSDVVELAIQRGESIPPLLQQKTNVMLVSEIRAGAIDDIVASNPPEPETLEFDKRTWYIYPGNADDLRPAGPDMNHLRAFADAGFDIAYRPRNFPQLKAVGDDFPKEAHYLIYGGLQVTGFPNNLEKIEGVSQNYITGIIEGTEQDGMKDLSRKVPSVKLLSFNQDYVNRRLHPEELIDKYLLAANERGIRMMYIRPYTEEQLGDMFENTDKLIAGLSERLAKEGYTVGALPSLELHYEASPLLRGLSAIGIFAALVLLALMYPGVWGLLVALGVFGLAFIAGRFDWDTLALAAALTFPVIGYGHLKETVASLGVASLLSLAGAALLSAVGSDRQSMLSITPFAGVGATLVVPPALYLFHYALRYRRPAQWVTEFWNTPIRIGHIGLAFIGLAAASLIFLRRGNFPVLPATEAEIAFRAWLSDLFVRPRFKEMIGHPMAVLGLTNKEWPGWIKAILLTGGVVAQSTILNSFSHYHTPLIISLQRTLIALGLGLVFGFVLLPLARFSVTLMRRWLASADSLGNQKKALGD
ncbi:MAG: DUF5693 family protein [Trueperaceae bacterium]